MADEETTAEKPQRTPSKGGDVCGHENKHYSQPMDGQGKPISGTAAKLTCTSPKGHQPVRVVRVGPKGEDQSTYEIIHNAKYTMFKQGVLKEAEAAWTDAAGTAIQ